MYHYPSLHSLEFQLHIFRPFDIILQLLDILICFCHSFFSVCLSYVISIELSSSSLILSSAVSLLLMSQLKALFISVSECLCHFIFFLLKFNHLPCTLSIFYTRDILNVVIFYVSCLIVPPPESVLCMVLMLILSLCSLWIFSWIFHALYILLKARYLV